jgi:hypothetical protein
MAGGPPSFLILSSRGPVGHHDRIAILEPRRYGRRHLGGGLDVHHLDVERRRQRDGSGHQSHARPTAGGLRRDGEAHPARRVIAEEPHSVDRLVRGARRDHDRGAGEVARTDGRGHHRGDLVGLGHPPHPLVARRERPLGRPDDHGTPATQRGQMLLGTGVVPHARVHRRGEHEWAARFEQGGGDQVVGESERELRDDVRGGRRDDRRGGFVRETDVQHGLGTLEDVGVDRAAGESCQRIRPDETGCRRRHDSLDGQTGVAQPPGQREGLVRRDAAGDGEEDNGGRLAAGGVPAHGGPRFLPVSRDARR